MNWEVNDWAFRDLGPAPCLGSSFATLPLSHCSHASRRGVSDPQVSPCLRAFALARPSAWEILPIVISHGSYPHLLQVSA